MYSTFSCIGTCTIQYYGTPQLSVVISLTVAIIGAGVSLLLMG